MIGSCYAVIYMYNPEKTPAIPWGPFESHIFCIHVEELATHFLILSAISNILVQTKTLGSHNPWKFNDYLAF